MRSDNIVKMIENSVTPPLTSPAVSFALAKYEGGTSTALSPPSEQSVHDILIVGGGLSGLVTAYRIAKQNAGLRVAVIEAHKRCGGQIKSVPDGGELGARWIGSNQPHIQSLCDELGLELEPLAGPDPYRQRQWPVDRVLWFAPLARFELDRFLRYVDLLAIDYGPGRVLADRSVETVESFLCGQLFFEASRDVVRIVVRAMSGCEARDLPFREFMALCHSSDGLTPQLESLTGTGGDLLTIKPTFATLVERLVEAIGTDNILLNTKVTRAYEYKNRIELLTKTTPKLAARIVVLAIPLHEEQRITFFPARPKQLRAVPASRRPHFVSAFNAHFADAFWRHEGLSGSFMFRRENRLSAVLHESGPSSLSGVVYHDADDPAYEPQLDALAELYERFEDADTVHYTCEHKNWPQTQYRGLSAAGLNDSKRFVRASANAASAHRGWADGAVQAGRRGAITAMLRVRRTTTTTQLAIEADGGQQPADGKALKRQRPDCVELWCASWNLYNGASMAVLMPLAVVVIWCAWRRCDGVQTARF